MVGCCWCTTSSCYQDKDKVEYYVSKGAKNPPQGFEFKRPEGQRVNGSDYDRRSAPRIEEEESKNAPDSKLIDLK